MPDFYAYIYFDPRTDEPFYVGKGQGYRARKHLHQATNRGVAERLAGLRSVGLAPRIETFDCDNERHAFELERQLIEAFGRQCDGGPLCNVLEGGERSAGFEGRKHTEKSKAKIQAAMKARVMTPEHKAKIRAKARLRTFPPLARERAVEWSRSPEGRRQRAKQAKEMGPEHQKRMTEAARRANIGRIESEETRRKKSEAMKGRVFSPETIAKMSAAQRRRYAKPNA